MATNRATRYRATTLSDVIDAQGRIRRWVAAQAGIDQPTLSHLEKGRRTIPADVADRIAMALQTPMLDLFEPVVGDDDGV
ncbi:MAG TPA: helix-turn-helix transcriptional regulator [Steroidobacteraceae bacterium]|nr:helix-turn-helix transcriptional regulator [Steroidobacteraceae bacterium]